MPTLSLSFTLLLLAQAEADAALDAASEASECEMIYPFVIDTVRDPAIPVWDAWQFLRDGVPVSDQQILSWAAADERVAELSEEVDGRGSWIYGGLGVSAAGTAVSSIGWLLYGQDNVNPSVSLTMGIGGIIVGVTGFLLVADAIQAPLEPFLAPTPQHRISRSEGHTLVYRLNREYGVCRSAKIADQ